MADPINLNKARKARDKQRRTEEARENRVLFGRTKAEKIETAASKARIERALDGAKRDPEA
jgi:hypothetical protein